MNACVILLAPQPLPIVQCHAENLSVTCPFIITLHCTAILMSYLYTPAADDGLWPSYPFFQSVICYNVFIKLPSWFTGKKTDKPPERRSRSKKDQRNQVKCKEYCWKCSFQRRRTQRWSVVATPNCSLHHLSQNRVKKCSSPRSSRVNHVSVGYYWIA